MGRPESISRKATYTKTMEWNEFESNQINEWTKIAVYWSLPSTSMYQPFSEQKKTYRNKPTQIEQSSDKFATAKSSTLVIFSTVHAWMRTHPPYLTVLPLAQCVNSTNWTRLIGAAPTAQSGSSRKKKQGVRKLNYFCTTTVSERFAAFAPSRRAPFVGFNFPTWPGP